MRWTCLDQFLGISSGIDLGVGLAGFYKMAAWIPEAFRNYFLVRL